MLGSKSESLSKCVNRVRVFLSMKLFQVRNLNLPSTPEGCAYRRILGTFQFVSDFYCGCWELQRLRFRR